MGLLPTVICRNCHQRYSALKSRCPHCGVQRAREVSRAPMTTADVTPGTAASARAAANNKWQMIFGAILLAAVVLAVIVLINVSLKEGGTKKLAEPTPTPEPTPAVTSIAITYAGEIKLEFATHIGDQTPLSATTYPLDVVATVEWSSSDESKCTVSQDGVVTALGPGWCTIYAQCGDVRAECRVLVFDN